MNPWEEISLETYEKHMSLASIQQLSTLSAMMKQQINHYLVTSIMILGIAGGNGLEHVDPSKFRKVYGVDINSDYLSECVSRHGNLRDIFVPIQADLMNESIRLPKAELIIADLLIEYIGYDSFLKAVNVVNPEYVSCIIQINTDDGFVSDSPYIHAFDGLNSVHHEVDKAELSGRMQNAGYDLILQVRRDLPNGKQLLQMDYRRK